MLREHASAGYHSPAVDLTPDQCRLLLDAARVVILGKVRGDDPAPSAILSSLTPARTDDPVFWQPAGCFVSLHEIGTHRLRGCVGRIEADRTLLEAVRSAARSVLRDPRFDDDPVQPHELERIELEISVLAPPRPCPSIEQYQPLRDGIIVHFAGRTGLFLPQVARETGWSREQLLARLCSEKMGLPADAWQDEEARLETFSTLILGPEPLLAEFFSSN
jgi:AmmeMemoRadiSam system protein A